MKYAEFRKTCNELERELRQEIKTDPLVVENGTIHYGPVANKIFELTVDTSEMTEEEARRAHMMISDLRDIAVQF